MHTPYALARLAIRCSVLTVAWMPNGAQADNAALLMTFRQEFVDLTPGRGNYPAQFQMGRDNDNLNERPVHAVTMAAFAIARYEVPQNLWQAVMGSNPSRWKGSRNSVEMLSFEDAVEFCRRITAQLRAADLITSRQVVRLPSEAEWEYAARAGTQTVYSFGDDAAALGEFAWSTHNAAGNDPPVGAKRPNAWQLYDMHGYLWEWCADTWHENYAGAPTDGSAWLTKGAPERGVLRGGSWKDRGEKLTSSFRRPASHDLKDDAIGLRCVLASE